MRSFIVFAMMFLTLLEAGSFPSSMAQPKSEDMNHAEALREARWLADELGDTIRGLLFQEFQRGGPVGAIRVCSEVAQEMTREFNRRSGHHARRVSVRYRNSQNAPDGYEQQVLMRMEVENRQRRLAKEYVEVMKEPTGEVLRYLRPLIVAPVCLNCHGLTESMAPDIKRMLTETYPEDRATGFQEGDLRGAISIKIVLNPKQTR